MFFKHIYNLFTLKFILKIFFRNVFGVCQREKNPLAFPLKISGQYLIIPLKIRRYRRPLIS